MSVEDTLVKMATDPQPPDYLGDNLWVSKPQPSRSRARQLAQLAIATVKAEHPKATAHRIGFTNEWRGVVYAGRRSRREVAKAGA